MPVAFVLVGARLPGTDPQRFALDRADIVVATGIEDGHPEELAAVRSRHPDSVVTVPIRALDDSGAERKLAIAAALAAGADTVVIIDRSTPRLSARDVDALLGPLHAGTAAATYLEPRIRRRAAYPARWVRSRLLGADLGHVSFDTQAMSADALRAVHYEAASDFGDFDVQLLIQILGRGLTAVGVSPDPGSPQEGDKRPIGTSSRSGRGTFDVARATTQYRLGRIGIGTHRWVPADAEYGLKEGEGTSHTTIAELLRARAAGRVLDLGCSGGRLSEQLRRQGHTVVGVDFIEVPGVRDRVDEFYVGDLEQGIPGGVTGQFDAVVAADVIEHVRDPGRLLRQMAARVAPGGVLIISTPNFGHWYSRGRVTFGVFGYDRRGILDETHLRFFIRSSLRRLLSENGLQITEMRYTGLPFAIVSTQAEGLLSKAVRAIDRGLVRARPTMFGYQFVVVATPRQGFPSKSTD